MTQKATLYGIGVGPGDPELVTLKARRLIEAAVVIAYPMARHGRSIARAIAAPYLRSDQIELAMIYPVTTEESDHPGGYEAALSQFYDQWAATLATHLTRVATSRSCAKAIPCSTARTSTCTSGSRRAIQPSSCPA